MALGQQFLMQAFGKMAFLATHDHPAQRQRAPLIHDTHRRHAAAPDYTTVHPLLDWLLRQALEQLRGDEPKPAINGLLLVFEEAREALGEMSLRRAIAGRMVGDRGQVRVPATRQAADQRAQRIEMLFPMSGRARLVKSLELYAALYRTNLSVQ